MSTSPKMPGIEETRNSYSLTECSQTYSQGIPASEVEELVLEMKENLTLTSFKSKIQRKKTRVCPYKVPSRSLMETNCELCITRQCKVHLRNVVTVSSTCDDPYDMLQELLRNGCLIKEAVRRLQRGSSKKHRGFCEE